MGYLRYPTICGDTVAFVCEDDLWSVPAEGGRAWRLTAEVAEVTDPVISPDGSRIAFAGSDEGPREAYVMAADGGPARRLSYDGVGVALAGWSPDGERILYASTAGQPFSREQWLHAIPAAGGVPERMAYGLASAVSYGPDGAVVIGRRSADPARWKRYRGGTAGDIWVDPDGTGTFRPLVRLAGNLARPTFVGDRVYFLSDHEGIGNVYSCTVDGSDLRRHTDHERFYARNLRADGSRLVYHCAGELWLLDPSDRADEPRRIDVRLGSSVAQRHRQFVSAAQYLDSAALGPDGSDLAITARGKAYSLAHWEGPVRQHGELDGVRYRLLSWLDDHERLVAVAGDEAEDEHLEILTADGSAPPRVLRLEIGRALELAVSPHADVVAIANHRQELVVVDLAAAEPSARILDSSRYGAISGLAWSPDGRWLAYARPHKLAPSPDHPDSTGIALCKVETGETWPVTEPLLRDWGPAFDPEGKYLYFVGNRDFEPVDDALHFELGFPLGSRPYAVTLRADVPSPFVLKPRPVVSEAAERQRKAEEERREIASEQAGAPGSSEDGGGGDDAGAGAGAGGKKAEPEPIEVDVEGLTDRVVAFPVPEGRYSQVAGIRGKALFTSLPVATNLVEPGDSESGGKGVVLEAYDFEAGKTDKLLDGVAWFELDRGAHTMLYQAGERLRVLKAGDKAPEDDSGDPTRATGWIDLDRVKVSVRPGAEWRQMFREAWRLQRDHYWSEDMGGLSWREIYERYLPLVDQVSTRSELSDLLWELQGELGTSHAYEFGGAYRPGPYYAQGFLGADWAYDEGTGRFRVERIVRGDPWREDASSPLLRPGVDVRPGDVVLAINGQPIGRLDGSGSAGVGSAGSGVRLPGEPLVNHAGEEVQLTVVRGDDEPRTVTVRAAESEFAARYRDWVDANRAYVHEQSGGRLGYLHVPDMMHRGFGEFHRGFLTEYDREGLVVDVRFNGGGYVSGLVIEKLRRRRIGYDYTRYAPPEPYPAEAPRGPMVAICNAEAGSDGDIVSHAFKSYDLGPLIGTRTWGGVIGYTDRGRLADGTVTTQPELAFGFDDVGWGVENHGTDPDIEVDIAPQDYAKGVDPQLDKAIEVGLAELQRRPAHTARPGPRPRLAPPTLPPRAPSGD